MMKYKNAKVLLHGARVDVLSVEVEHPKGGTLNRELVDHPGAVVILPLLDSERVLLIRNERFVVQQTLWELPAGTLEPGEELEACAKRELEEETGYSCSHLTFLFDFFSSPGFCNEKLFVFLAHDLHAVGQRLDDTEMITPEPTYLNEALRMVQEGVIRDGKTIAALLYFQTYCRN